VAARRIVGSTRFYDLATWDWSSYSPGTDADRRQGRPDVAAIGYTWLEPSAQRSPVNTEAKLLMMTHAFEQWEVRVVRLQTDARNLRSRRAIERLGCTLDGVIRAERPAADGGVRDSAVYSMLDHEWPRHRIQLIRRLER
jgi:RimJ/RimL family protein N-acetyltransferase